VEKVELSRMVKVKQIYFGIKNIKKDRKSKLTLTFSFPVQDYVQMQGHGQIVEKLLKISSGNNFQNENQNCCLLLAKK
jgi:hypothetical protein